MRVQVRNGVYRGKVLNDDKTVAQSGLEKDAVVVLTLKHQDGDASSADTGRSIRENAEARLFFCPSVPLSFSP